MQEQSAVWTTMPGPWGPFHVAATRDGIVAIDWLTTDSSFDARLGQRLRGPLAHVADAGTDGFARMHLATAIAALEALLDGRPPRSDLRFDLADRPAWDRRVLEAVAMIPWGRTASYGGVARQIGAPRAARAVGGAVGRNPIGLLIGCHRVIAGDGSIGGYGGDAWGSHEERLTIKRELLRREGVEVVSHPTHRASDLGYRRS
jgi:O-6-methylguanine DNA methyltransferase